MLSQAFLKTRHRIMPNTKTVTYHRATSTGHMGGVTVDSAESRPVKIEEMAMASITVAATAKTWHLWVEKLSGIEPQIGDKLTDPEGTDWYVKLPTLELADTRWKLICTKGRA